MNLRNYIGDRDFYRRLLAVMTPVLIQNVITNFVGLLDNLMVGRVGTEPMSGVAIVNQFQFVFNLCIFGGLAGAGIFTAQFFGSGDEEGVRHTFRIKLWIGVISVGVFSLLFLFYGDQLISLFLHQGDESLDLEATLNFGRDYMKVMLWGMPLFALSQAYSSTLRECGETVLPMQAGVIAVIVNLVGNYILIYGKLGAPVMGVVGAAVATVLSRVVETAIIMVWTHRHSGQMGFIRGAYSSLAIPAPLLRKVAVMGFPLLINEVLWSGGMTVLSQSYSLRGLEVVSATNISNTVANLFFCAFFAMGTAISIIVGQLLGAGELDRAVDEDRKLIAFSVALCTVVGVVMALLAPLIPQLYNTTDTVKKLAGQFLLVTSAMMPVNAFTHTCYFTLRSGGKTMVTFLFDSVFVWTLCIPVAVALPRCTDLPILPIYIIVTSLDLIKCVLGYVLLKSRRWVNNIVGKAA